MNSTIITAIAALIIGLGGGYLIADNKIPATTHIMPNDSIMSNTMDDMTSELEGKTGDEFDKAFIQEMIVHHEGAVAMAQQALQHAKHSEIKEMAEDIISAQTQEVITMRNWLQSWYDVR